MKELLNNLLLVLKFLIENVIKFARITNPISDFKDKITIVCIILALIVEGLGLKYIKR